MNSCLQTSTAQYYEYIMYSFHEYNVNNRRKVHSTAVHSFSKYVVLLRLFHLFSLCAFLINTDWLLQSSYALTM
jgi:hypothetical protein